MKRKVVMKTLLLGNLLASGAIHLLSAADAGKVSYSEKLQTHGKSLEKLWNGFLAHKNILRLGNDLMQRSYILEKLANHGMLEKKEARQQWWLELLMIRQMLINVDADTANRDHEERFLYLFKQTYRLSVQGEGQDSPKIEIYRRDFSVEEIVEEVMQRPGGKVLTLGELICREENDSETI